MKERAGLAVNIFQNNNFPILQLYGKHVQNNLVCFWLQTCTKLARNYFGHSGLEEIVAILLMHITNQLTTN